MASWQDPFSPSWGSGVLPGTLTHFVQFKGCSPLRPNGTDYKSLCVMNNYEYLKLNVYNPELINLSILALLFILCCVSIQKTEVQNLLTVEQSNQLKGFAIVLIILGHLWVHVVDSLPKLLFGGEAVALFLLLSGYGLTCSYRSRVVPHRAYFMARMKKVMVPYWIITVFLLSLDFMILNKTYSLQDIIMTMLGININTTTRYIDYVRWFITFILIWYVFFFIAISYFKDGYRLFFLIICAVILFPLDYYITQLGFYQVFAFPIGCTMGYYYKDLNSAFKRQPTFFISIAVTLLIVVILYKFASSRIFYPFVPTIIIKAIDEGSSIAFCAALVIISATIGFYGYQSLLLSFLGTISYELFLLHGAFLIKYNPIINRSEASLPLTFSVFMFSISIISWIIHLSIVKVYVKK